MNSTVSDFTLSAYVAMIEALQTRGFKIHSYAKADPVKPHLILRHDIDFDLGAAVELATIEANQGWCANYFVLMRSEFYNPMSPASSDAISRLRALGHRIGLHFDAAAYPPDPERFVTAVKDECAILEDICGAPVEAFSLHRPHPDLIDHDFDVPGRINVYAPAFFRDIGYCSDSRGEWRYGHPLAHPAVGAKQALQLVTHPIWWTQPDGVPNDKCIAILNARATLLDAEMMRNCLAYRGRC